MRMETVSLGNIGLAKKTRSSESLSWKLGKLTPSDRRALQLALNDTTQRQDVIDAVEFFVIGWENADWLENYSIVRVGRWIAKQGDDNLTRHFAQWAGQNQTPARNALLEGIRDGASL
jgi:hypothetical protein